MNSLGDQAKKSLSKFHHRVQYILLSRSHEVEAFTGRPAVLPKMLQNRSWPELASNDKSSMRFPSLNTINIRDLTQRGRRRRRRWQRIIGKYSKNCTLEFIELGTCTEFSLKIQRNVKRTLLELSMTSQRKLS